MLNLLVDGLPEHCPIGVSVDGDGPYDSGELEFDHVACWCGQDSVPCSVEAAQLAMMDQAAGILADHDVWRILETGYAECVCGSELDAINPEAHRKHVIEALASANLLALNAEWGVLEHGHPVQPATTRAAANLAVAAAGGRRKVAVRHTTGWDVERG